MKTEAELRELHSRITKALTYAKSIQVPLRDLRELIQIKIQLEWILGEHTASAETWQASVFKAVGNLEALKRTHERSRQAASN